MLPRVAAVACASDQSFGGDDHARSSHFGSLRHGQRVGAGTRRPRAGAERRDRSRAGGHRYRGDRRHRPAPVAEPAERADRRQRLHRRGAGAAEHHQHDPSAAGVAEHHLHQDELHRVEPVDPRRRQSRRRDVGRFGCRRRDQRDAAVRAAAVRDRVLRPRPDRGAARAAGYTVRPQRDLGRHRSDHQEARRPPRCGGRVRVRQFQQQEGDRRRQHPLQVDRTRRRPWRLPGRRTLSQARRLHP